MWRNSLGAQVQRLLGYGYGRGSCCCPYVQCKSRSTCLEPQMVSHLFKGHRKIEHELEPPMACDILNSELLKAELASSVSLIVDPAKGSQRGLVYELHNKPNTRIINQSAMLGNCRPLSSSISRRSQRYHRKTGNHRTMLASMPRIRQRRALSLLDRLLKLLYYSPKPQRRSRSSKQLEPELFRQESVESFDCEEPKLSVNEFLDIVKTKSRDVKEHLMLDECKDEMQDLIGRKMSKYEEDEQVYFEPRKHILPPTHRQLKAAEEKLFSLAKEESQEHGASEVRKPSKQFEEESKNLRRVPGHMWYSTQTLKQLDGVTNYAREMQRQNNERNQLRSPSEQKRLILQTAELQMKKPRVLKKLKRKLKSCLQQQRLKEPQMQHPFPKMMTEQQMQRMGMAQKELKQKCIITALQECKIEADLETQKGRVKLDEQIQSLCELQKEQEQLGLVLMSEQKNVKSATENKPKCKAEEGKKEEEASEEDECSVGGGGGKGKDGNDGEDEVNKIVEDLWKKFQADEKAKQAEVAKKKDEEKKFLELSKKQREEAILSKCKELKKKHEENKLKEKCQKLKEKDQKKKAAKGDQKKEEAAEQKKGSEAQQKKKCDEDQKEKSDNSEEGTKKKCAEAAKKKKEDELRKKCQEEELRKKCQEDELRKKCQDLELKRKCEQQQAKAKKQDCNSEEQKKQKELEKRKRQAEEKQKKCREYAEQQKKADLARKHKAEEDKRKLKEAAAQQKRYRAEALKKKRAEADEKKKRQKQEEEKRCAEQVKREEEQCAEIEKQEKEAALKKKALEEAKKKKEKKPSEDDDKCKDKFQSIQGDGLFLTPAISSWGIMGAGGLEDTLEVPILKCLLDQTLMCSHLLPSWRQLQVNDALCAPWLKQIPHLTLGTGTSSSLALRRINCNWERFIMGGTVRRSPLMWPCQALGMWRCKNHNNNNENQ